MRLRAFLKSAARPLLVAAVAAIVLPLALRGVLTLRFAPDRHDVDTAPLKPVAIVFGAQIYSNGLPSPMLYDRVATGAALYKAGKVRALLVTGDNSRVDYDEPSSMKQTAIQLGVPADAVVVDYAGRRTYDSCYRAHAIFKVDNAILVTQSFHLDRALMLCNALGVASSGVPADFQSPLGYGPMTAVSEFREFPAVFLGTIDLIIRPTPILGDPLPIDVSDDADG